MSEIPFSTFSVRGAPFVGAFFFLSQGLQPSPQLLPQVVKVLKLGKVQEVSIHCVLILVLM